MWKVRCIVILPLMLASCVQHTLPPAPACRQGISRRSLPNAGYLRRGSLWIWVCCGWFTTVRRGFDGRSRFGLCRRIRDRDEPKLQ